MVRQRCVVWLVLLSHYWHAHGAAAVVSGSDDSSSNSRTWLGLRQYSRRLARHLLQDAPVDPCAGRSCGNGVCQGGACVCNEGWTGDSCQTPPDPCLNKQCGNGVCQGGACVCNEGWTGDSCQTPPDPCLNKQCGNGVCQGGACVCNEGWTGDSCQTPPDPCLNKQCGNGVCQGGACVCNEGWTGDSCQTPPDPCLNKQCGNGVCQGGACVCNEGWTGDSCQTPPDPCLNKQCGNGVCQGGACVCNEGWTGDSCQTPPDPCLNKQCGNGVCQGGACVCNEGWTGDSCQTPPDPCLNKQCGNGVCQGGACVCNEGWTGDSCQTPPDPCLNKQCGNGVCQGGACVCNEGWTGDSCQTPPDPCLNKQCGNGVCQGGACVCNEGWTGDACQTPPDPCLGKTCGTGSCQNGACICSDGWTGDSCQTPPDPCLNKQCGNGVCQGGACVCNEGWTGAACETPPDPCAGKNCGQGTCQGGTCVCSDGYTGANCETAPDPCAGKDCGQGTCTAGACVCSDGYTGDTCNVAPDPCASKPCGAHGTCQSGSCICTDGYTGASCETPPDPCSIKSCGSHGTCSAGVCSCTDGWTGDSCEVAPDPCTGISCNGHGSCSAGACSCVDGYTGAACETAPDLCAGKSCSGHGQCSQGACSCNPGYTGADCEQAVQSDTAEPDSIAATAASDPCQGKTCSGHGQCSGGVCSCTDGWSGADCGVQPAAAQLAEADPCASVSCANGGTCQQGTCTCQSGYTGTLCETAVETPTAAPPPTADTDTPATVDASSPALPDAAASPIPTSTEQQQPQTANPEPIQQPPNPDSSTAAAAPADQAASDPAVPAATAVGGPAASPEPAVAAEAQGSAESPAPDVPADGAAAVPPTPATIAVDPAAGSPASAAAADGTTAAGASPAPADPCAGVDCGQSGSCGADGSCVCLPGWIGKHCEQAEDPCMTKNCGSHGKCSNGQCVCDNGWQGDDCTTTAATLMATNEPLVDQNVSLKLPSPDPSEPPSPSPTLQTTSPNPSSPDPQNPGTSPSPQTPIELFPSPSPSDPVIPSPSPSPSLGSPSPSPAVLLSPSPQLSPSPNPSLSPGPSPSPSPLPGAVQVSIGGIQTTMIVTYQWSLKLAGGGPSLTTTIDQDLRVPYTLTVTRTPSSKVAYVAGSVTVTNTGTSSLTVSSITVTVGGKTQSIALSECSSTSLTAPGSSSCNFNVTDAAAAPGSATASVTYSSEGTTIQGTASTTAPATYDYPASAAFTIGGSATVYAAVEASNLNVKFEGAAPPTQAPGVAVSDSKTFTYTMIVGRTLSCNLGQATTVGYSATAIPDQGAKDGQLTDSSPATFTVTGCNNLSPTISLSNLQTWAAVTWSWQMNQAASPASVQLRPGQAGSTNFEVQLTRTRQSGNYWLSGIVRVTNPTKVPLTISGVRIVGTVGQTGSVPVQCLGTSNLQGALVPTNGGSGGIPPVVTGAVPPGAMMTSGLTGSGLGPALAPGAQVDCWFNVTMGSGFPPTGTITAQASTSTGAAATNGGIASSDQVPINFAQPSQQWDIGGCVQFSVTGSSQGGSGGWLPQVTGLPQQDTICDSKTFSYPGQLTPAAPLTPQVCNAGVTVTTNAVATPIGGGSAASATATAQFVVTGCDSINPRVQPIPPQRPPVYPGTVYPNNPCYPNTRYPTTGYPRTGVYPGTAGYPGIAGYNDPCNPNRYNSYPTTGYGNPGYSTPAYGNTGGFTPGYNSGGVVGNTGGSGFRGNPPVTSVPAVPTNPNTGFRASNSTNPSGRPVTGSGLTVAVGSGISTSTQPDGFEWSLGLTQESTNSGPLTVPYTDKTTVKYTVTASRAVKPATNTISGQITVSNANAFAVNASAINAVANPSASSSTNGNATGYLLNAMGGVYILANCSKPYPVYIPAKGSVTCYFRGSVASSNPGQISGMVVTNIASASSAQSVPYRFNPTTSSSSGGGGSSSRDEDITGSADGTVTTTTGSRSNRTAASNGRCATLEVSFPRNKSVGLMPALTVQRSISTNSSSNSSRGTTLDGLKQSGGAASWPVCREGSFTVFATFGPFQASDCGNNTVPAIATATPRGQLDPTGRARSVLTLQVTGCPAAANTTAAAGAGPGSTAAGANSTAGKTGLSVTVQKPKVKFNSTAIEKWTVNSEVLGGPVTVNFTEAANLKFKLSWDRKSVMRSVISGVVMVTNTKQPAVEISGVTVKLSGNDKVTTVATAAASCDSLSVSIGRTAVCSYSTTLDVPTDGDLHSLGVTNGVITAEVTIKGGTDSVTSATVPYTSYDATTLGGVLGTQEKAAGYKHQDTSTTPDQVSAAGYSSRADWIPVSAGQQNPDSAVADQNGLVANLGLPAGWIPVSAHTAEDSSQVTDEDFTSLPGIIQSESTLQQEQRAVMAAAVRESAAKPPAQNPGVSSPNVNPNLGPSIGPGGSVTAKAVQGSDGASSCADVIYKITLDPALQQTGVAKPLESKTQRVCGPGSTVVEQKVGPFTSKQCSKYMVTSTTKLQPSVGSQPQDALSTIATAQVAVTGC